MFSTRNLQISLYREQGERSRRYALWGRIPVCRISFMADFVNSPRDGKRAGRTPQEFPKESMKVADFLKMTEEDRKVVR